MAMTFTQTDDTGSFGCTATELLGCSGLSAGGDLTTNDARACVNGGTPGTGSNIINLFSSETNVVEKAFICDVGSSVSWDSGTWTIRLNVTASNMNITWTRVYVCRINSTCVNQETIGSNTAVGISLGTTGVKSTTVSGSAQTPAVGDKVLIVLAFTNGAMSVQAATSVPNQDIDSPFTASSNVSITSGLGQLTLTGKTPTVFVLDPKTVSTGLGQLAITGFAPTLAISDNVNVSAGLGALTLTGLAPSIAKTDNVFIAAGAGALTITGFEPTVSKHIQPALGTLTITGYQPTVQIGASVSVNPATGALVITGLQPTIQTTAHVSVNAETGALVITGYQPTIQSTAHVSVNAQTGALVITGYQPSVLSDAGVSINTALGQLMLSGHIPSIDVTGETPAETSVKTGGRGDDHRRRRSIFKPTGLEERSARKTVDERIAETIEIAEEIRNQVEPESVQIAEFRPMETMSPQEIDFEIGVLLRKKMRTEEEEMLLLLLAMA